MLFCLGNVTYLLPVTHSIIIIISTYSTLLFKFKFGLLSNIQQMISLVPRLLPCRGGAWVEAKMIMLPVLIVGVGEVAFVEGIPQGFYLLKPL